jgi:hypothetical protein
MARGYAMTPVPIGLSAQRIGAIAVVAACLALSKLQADDWPQPRGPARDEVWRETGILETLPSAGLTIRWRAKVGLGYSGPVFRNRGNAGLDIQGGIGLASPDGSEGEGGRGDRLMGWPHEGPWLKHAPERSSPVVAAKALIPLSQRGIFRKGAPSNHDAGPGPTQPKETMMCR